MKIQGMDRSTLPYIAPFQPYSSWIALVITSVVIFFKGFDSFIKPSPTSTADAFSVRNFITNYVGLVRPLSRFSFFENVSHRRRPVADVLGILPFLEALSQDKVGRSRRNGSRYGCP